VSVLRPGDEEIHFSDNSHRWMCPDPDADEDVWRDRIRAHIRQHAEEPDSPAWLIGWQRRR